MEADLKAKWIANLRSGKYAQGRGLLRGLANDYCCLGVLCDISGLGQWENRTDDSMMLFISDKGKPYMEDVVGELREDLGLTNDQVNKLISLNDTEKLTFAQIADWIEVNV